MSIKMLRMTCLSGLMVSALAGACSSSSSSGGNPGSEQGDSFDGLQVPASCGTFNGTTGLWPDGGIEIDTCSEYYGPASATGAPADKALGQGQHCPTAKAACACLKITPGVSCGLSIIYVMADGYNPCMNVTDANVPNCTEFKVFTVSTADAGTD